jgi:hypothetical protein
MEAEHTAALSYGVPARGGLTPSPAVPISAGKRMSETALGREIQLACDLHATAVAVDSPYDARREGADSEYLQ